MKIVKSIFPLATVACACAFLLVGCGEQQTAAPTQQTPVPRGEPIKGEPIKPAVEEEPSVETAEVAKPESEASATSTRAIEEKSPTVAAEAKASKTKLSGEAATLEEAKAALVEAEAAMKKAEEELKANLAQKEALEKAAAVAKEKAAASLKNAKPDKNGFVTVGFDQLAGFEYVMPDEFPEIEGESPSADAGVAAAPAEAQPAAEEKDQIPAEVRSLNKKRVALEGFMLPLKVEDGKITEMLVMRDQSMCCYGTVPKINEWVSVRMTGPGVDPVMDEPVTLYGTLKVGEIRENGYLVGIYELDGERMGSRIDL